MSNTELTWGEQSPLTPVFGLNDSRLLPGSATGVSLRSHLTLRVKHSLHRSSSEGRYPDHNEIRFIAEYPINIF